VGEERAVAVSSGTGTGRWIAAALVATAIAMWVTGPNRVVHPAAGSAGPSLDFTLHDMSGQVVHLADFKGRPLIINFWATWCAPCKAEIPGFVALVDKYKDQQLTVLGVSTDDSPEELRQFAPAYKVNYPLLVGAGHDDMLKAYQVSFLPITWLIKRDGSVLLKKEGTDTREWFESQIQALF